MAVFATVGSNPPAAPWPAAFSLIRAWVVTFCANAFRWFGVAGAFDVNRNHWSLRNGWSWTPGGSSTLTGVGPAAEASVMPRDSTVTRTVTREARRIKEILLRVGRSMLPRVLGRSNERPGRRSSDARELVGHLGEDLGVPVDVVRGRGRRHQRHVVERRHQDAAIQQV